MIDLLIDTKKNYRDKTKHDCVNKFKNLFIKKLKIFIMFTKKERMFRFRVKVKINKKKNKTI